MQNLIIRLEGLRFHSHIGVSEQERAVGNEFIVDVAIHIDASAFETEKLQTTVSYADVYDLISAEMAKEWLLLESAASRISSDIKGGWQSILKVSVKITKCKPPISGIDGACSVEYEIL